MKSLYVVIGERIQQFLAASDVSQKDFAQKIDVSPQVMNKIIQGKKAINAVEIQRIADALSLSMDELVGKLAQPAVLADPVLFMIGETNNEQTKEKLRFLDHVMDQMIRIEQIVK